ncbi:(Fe-S)-binding protein [Sphingobacterium spiritivorum]|uniref:Cysteine-rich domain protein n=1 Tax=Sphingobacterium spiritivorum ATCC 33861 TaxID=525373 RepID=D7VSV0_SPHSI|nr:(Fe-S)-binding protein [Sphingobacterium spiritivorum]EFK56851.1 cysteine-rich domain protein [Sphingobacterium spiritivorum ATCC 33861]QQT35126.1 (Fe-S)-binding protein [Sphingobacterium spiritivorum]WQD36030.1 (Fe-S)-binding protein [Sphingobacterium spiritivorum]SUJ03489.1 Lactate utilization protein A [Sphingobacterium spiritivorum]
MRVELFVPCFIDQMYPETAFNTIKLLERVGCEVSYNPEQTCCGQPAYNAGFWDEAKEIGHKFLNDFSEEHYIVAPSASCVGMVKNGYDDLFTNSVEHNRCRNVQRNVFEISEFLIHIAKRDYFGAELVGTAVYHDSCAALRECKIKEEPRQLLSKVGGLELIPMKDQETCCGFGGTFAVKFEGISSAMAEQKVQHALDVEADYIISTDASCLLHLQAYIDKHQLPVRTIHLVDVLTSGWANI